MYLERGRAERMTFKQYSSTNVNGNIISVDSDIVPARRHWIIENITAYIFYVGNVATDFHTTGIFLCPKGAPQPANRGAGSFASPGDIQASRPIKVATNDPLNNTQAPAGAFAVEQGFITATTSGINLPEGWFVRVVGDSTGATLPGAGSLVLLTMMLLEEENC